MRTSVAADVSHREPDNELYDFGCDLVQVTAAIRRAAEAPEAVRAVPAVLGCIEAALHELLLAAVALEATTAHAVDSQPRRCDNPRTASTAERMHRGYANLQDALVDAERASAAARSLAGRALTAVGATSPATR